jgi:hypothetical protein
VSRLPLSILVTLVVAAGDASAQPTVQQGHIEANVPGPSNFNHLLQRDLLAYFHSRGVSGAVEVKADLLRNEPTQSGTAYPKFYAWVAVSDQSKVVAEGAVRVVAIARTRFEITDFVSRGAARQDRALLEAVFPPPLIQSIQQRAAR